MKGILAIFALVVLIVNVYGRHGFNGGPGGPGGPWDWPDRQRGGRPPFDGRGFGRPQQCCMGLKEFFPACKNFFAEIENILKRKGRPNCPKGNCDQCMSNYMMGARNCATVEPSKKCIEQITMFLLGKVPHTSPPPDTSTFPHM